MHSMFGKFGKRSSSTENIGENTENMVEVTYITINTEQDDLRSKLSTKLTVGREVGELVVADESISSRHCTLYLNQDVISIMDHSSASGTFINKKRIAPGKVFILDQKDKIKIGSLSLHIEKVHEPDPEAIQEQIDPLPNNVANVAQEQDLEGSPLEQNANEQEEEKSEFTEHAESALEGAGELSLGDMNIEELSLEQSEASDTTQEESSSDDNENLEQEEIDLEEIDLDESILSEEVYNEHNPSTSNSSKIEAQPVNPAKLKKDKKKLKKTVTKSKRDPSAGAFSRIGAWSIDSLVCLIILEIFYVYIDFEQAYIGLPSFIYEVLSEFFITYIASSYQQLIEFIPQLGNMIEDFLAYEPKDRIFRFLSFVFVFRIFCGALLGRSIGQILVGIRVEGSFLLKRAIFVIREVVGIVFLPFIIFDLPTLISKRSLKEVVTCSQYLAVSKFRFLISYLFIIPAFVVLYCFSPIFKGLELPTAIEVVDFSTLKKKDYVYENKTFSSILSMEYESNDKLLGLPDFSIEMRNKKRIRNSGLLFIDTEKGNTLKLRKIKEFSMFEIYESFVQKNFLSKYYQPTVFGIVNDVALKNNNFKFQIKDKKQLVQETKQLLSSSFGFDLESSFEFIQDNGLLYGGFRDLREKVDNLYDHKLKNLKFLQFGHEDIVLSEHRGYSSKDIYFNFFSIGSLKSALYYTSVDPQSKKGVKLMRSFQFIQKENQGAEDPASLFVQYLNDKEGVIDYELNQKIYMRYFEISRLLISQGHFVALEKVVKNIESLLAVLEEKDKLKNKKLYQNMTELIDAIKSQDNVFFNISKSKII